MTTEEYEAASRQFLAGTISLDEWRAAAKSHYYPNPSGDYLPTAEKLAALGFVLTTSPKAWQADWRRVYAALPGLVQSIVIFGQGTEHEEVTFRVLNRHYQEEKRERLVGMGLPKMSVTPKLRSEEEFEQFLRMIRWES